MRLEEIHARNPPLSEVDWKRVSEEVKEFSDNGKAILVAFMECLVSWGSKTFLIYGEWLTDQEHYYGVMLTIDTAMGVSMAGRENELQRINEAQEKAAETNDENNLYFIESTKQMMNYLENKIRVILNPKTN